MESSILGKLNFLNRYQKLRRGERFLLLGALVATLLLVSDVAVVRPIWNYHISLQERTAAEERKLVRNLLNINRKDLVEKEYEEYQKFMQSPGSDEEEIGEMLSEIEQKARSNQAILVDMKPRESKSHEFYKEYLVALDAEMDMPSWIQFVYQLEASEQLIRLTSAKLTRKTSEGTDEPVVKAEMEVTKTLPMAEK
ncbi:MAG: type 4a pilus biogenesis protein PilO [Deltaproteobacteria bacterium]|nr:type 4a pilus biogenesis protein PilO [Deltaproteobacteria bacterium]